MKMTMPTTQSTHRKRVAMMRPMRSQTRNTISTSPTEPICTMADTLALMLACSTGEYVS